MTVHVHDQMIHNFQGTFYDKSNEKPHFAITILVFEILAKQIFQIIQK